MTGLPNRRSSLSVVLSGLRLIERIVRARVPGRGLFVLGRPTLAPDRSTPGLGLGNSP